MTNVPTELPEDAASRAPKPRSLAETGLTVTFLAELLGKHLMTAGILDIHHIVQRLCLPGRLVEEVLHFMRREARVEVMAGEPGSGALRYGLTDRGRAMAATALSVSGYLGPAPVPLGDYARAVRAQSIHGQGVTSDAMRIAFRDVVIADDLLDRLGSSLNSGRAIFVYGPPGTGKTYIAQRLARVFSSTVLIPHAILVNDAVVSVFDGGMHKAIDRGGDDPLALDGGMDRRYVECERPAIVVGGELSEDMLDVRYEPDTREFRAPLQLKANNGVFVIDDMGRQRAAPQTIFNRWIVPMEERRDYLSLGSGRHFSVPFDAVLVFSTNMKPAELADDAFLRRIGYKIRFPYLLPKQYGRIWREQCRERGVPFDPEVLDYAVNVLHRKSGIPLLPCHPRDLIGLSLDRSTYMDQARHVTREGLTWAWDSYFADAGDPSGAGSRTGEAR